MCFCHFQEEFIHRVAFTMHFVVPEQLKIDPNYPTKATLLPGKLTIISVTLPPCVWELEPDSTVPPAGRHSL